MYYSCPCFPYIKQRYLFVCLFVSTIVVFGMVLLSLSVASISLTPFFFVVVVACLEFIHIFSRVPFPRGVCYFCYKNLRKLILFRFIYWHTSLLFHRCAFFMFCFVLYVPVVTVFISFFFPKGCNILLTQKKTSKFLLSFSSLSIAILIIFHTYIFSFFFLVSFCFPSA